MLKKVAIPDQIEQAVAELARRQHGYITRPQLIGLGIGPGAIKYRVAKGRLIRVHAGVYAVGHVPALTLDRAHGALLACGGQAGLSHGSAGAVWKVYERFATPFEVTARGERRGSDPLLFPLGSCMTRTKFLLQGVAG